MILDEIVKSKQEVLARSKLKVPLSELEVLSSKKLPPRDFASALQGDSVKLIAEIKRASPSKGLIRPDLNAVKLAQTYAQNGAAAISILTEERYFHGNLEELSTVTRELQLVKIPLLRKDFIFDPYQVYESRVSGADALLLIAAILSSEQLTELLWLSHNLGMQCLVEVHNEDEVERAIQSGAHIVGINNRDLKTFTIDLATTKRLRPLVPPHCIVVSESGIKDRYDVQMLREWRVDAILIGDALVAAGDVAKKMKDLL